MLQTLKAFLKDESGDVIQYAIIIAVMVGLFIWGKNRFAPATQDTFEDTAGYMTDGIQMGQ